MMSRLARELAAEIANQDWSDSPYRLDRAGHRREQDSKAGTQVLTPDETGRVRTNVMWVVAQRLLEAGLIDDLHEFALACGVPRNIVFNRDGRKSGGITAGIRGGDLGAEALVKARTANAD